MSAALHCSTSSAGDLKFVNIASVVQCVSITIAVVNGERAWGEQTIILWAGIRYLDLVVMCMFL